jgi:NAD+ kinase
MKKASLNIVGITLKPNSTPEFYNILPNLCAWLIRRKRKVVFREDDKERVLKFFKSKNTEHLEFWDSKSFHQKVQIMFSLGGDGTLIGVCRRINSKIPVLGINLGRMGFITEFNKNEYFDRLGDILDGKYEITTKPLFHVSILRKNRTHFKDYFFNDAVLSKNDIARMIYLRAEFGTEHIYNLSGDGIIISTPLGSTAYSMAAGGPIVHPDVKGLVLTPICPHSLIHRPFVVPDTAKIALKILPPHHSVTLTLDCQVAINVDDQDVVLINAAKVKKVSLIKNPDRSYFETIREKFIFSKRD